MFVSLNFAKNVVSNIHVIPIGHQAAGSLLLFSSIGNSQHFDLRFQLLLLPHQNILKIVIRLLTYLQIDLIRDFVLQYYDFMAHSAHWYCITTAFHCSRSGDQISICILMIRHIIIISKNCSCFVSNETVLYAERISSISPSETSFQI